LKILSDVREATPVIVPFSAADFLDRALAVYRERIGIVDEPDQPAPPLGELTYRRVRELARAQAAALDHFGIGMGEDVGRCNLLDQAKADHRRRQARRQRGARIERPVA